MLNLSDLSRGERLLLDRRRRGESQVGAAHRRGTSRYTYRLWELDEVVGPKVPLGTIRPYEACVVLRRRARIPATALAATVGVTRWWLCQMERGMATPDRLLKYWRAKLA